MVLEKIFLFAFGLILLVKCSDIFVKSAASIAKKLGVSEFIIGLTLVALGTSIPELASAVTASIKHDGGIIVGNVAGANIANICLITGVAAAMVVIKTKKDMLYRDGYVMLLATILFAVFTFNGLVSRVEAAVLFMFYIAYSAFLFGKTSEAGSEYRFKEFITYFFRFRYLTTIKDGIISGFNHNHQSNIYPSPADKKKLMQMFRENIIKDLLLMLFAGIGVAFGANYFIDGAVLFATLLKMPQAVMGATIVSLGTTLPELSVTISAARKGYGNIAVGNVIGSCITNIFLIMGVSGLIFPLVVAKSAVIVIAIFLFMASLLLLFFIRSSWKITHLEGIVFLFAYLVFFIVLFITSV